MKNFWDDLTTSRLRLKAKANQDKHGKRTGRNIYLDSFYHSPTCWEIAYSFNSRGHSVTIIPIDCTKGDAYVADIAKWVYSANYQTIVAFESIRKEQARKQSEAIAEGYMSEEDFYRGIDKLHSISTHKG